jgi:hypothetical protein
MISQKLFLAMTRLVLPWSSFGTGLNSVRMEGQQITATNNKVLLRLTDTVPHFVTSDDLDNDTEPDTTWPYHIDGVYGVAGLNSLAYVGEFDWEALQYVKDPDADHAIPKVATVEKLIDNAQSGEGAKTVRLDVKGLRRVLDVLDAAEISSFELTVNGATDGVGIKGSDCEWLLEGVIMPMVNNPKFVGKGV